MCGIAGFIGNFDESILGKMGESLRTRGPDNLGVWHGKAESVGFVHTRLSIIDLSKASNQPMTSACGNLKIVFNGEIYNYRQLKSELKKDGYRFSTLGDTEVILNMYLKHGIDFLGKLNGIFALAIYDARSRKTFVARDGQGVKPLYFTSTKLGFIFASELKALLQEKSVDREINADAVAEYLTFMWAPTPSTMLKKVHKLEQGHYLTIFDSQVLDKNEFYDYPYSGQESNLNEIEAIEKTRTYLEQAVRSQLVSDVPMGAFLSGGLDSSSIVALAKKIEPDINLPCFTIDFKDNRLKEEGMAEDLPYAEQVASHLGLPLNKVIVGSDMIMNLEKMIYQLDEPQADLAPLNAMFICELAKSQGIKVLLSGTGGDDIFTGYRRHYALQKERYWNWLPYHARKMLRNASSMLPIENPELRRIVKAFQYADYNKGSRLASYFYWIDPAISQNLFSQEYKSKLSIYAPERQLIKSLNKLPANTSDLSKMLYLEQKHFLTDHNLNYTDKVSMAHGVEVRVPLLDPNLIKYVLSLPDDLKQRGSSGKWIFKKAMEPYLPNNVIYRPKTGFGVPLRFWMKNDLKPLIDDILSPSSIAKRGIFNHETILKIRKLDSEGRQDFSYPILSLVCIELWCRIFLDKSTPSYL